MSKRLFDISVSVVTLVALAPLLAAVSVAVKVSSAGPVLHRARRVGRHGRVFTLYKFRTMRCEYTPGPAVTVAGDTRITRLGRFLRRTKLDEIPQFYNVMKGDMSIVGPRPEDERYVSLYSANQRRVLAVRPGITSVASIAYRNEEQLLNGPDWEGRYLEMIMPEKLRQELEYVDRRSFWTDFGVIIRTITALFR